MEGIAESFGVDWTVDCSAADCAALEAKAAQGVPRLQVAAQFLWRQRVEREREGLETRLRDIVQLRLRGKVFGRKTAWKLVDSVWHRYVDDKCRAVFGSAE